MMREAFHLIVLLSLIATSIAAAQGEDHSSVRIERKSCQAPDGVTIVYSAGGAGKTALVFIHGGLADRTFFDEQLRAFARRYRVGARSITYPVGPSSYERVEPRQTPRVDRHL